MLKEEGRKLRKHDKTEAAALETEREAKSVKVLYKSIHTSLNTLKE